MKIILHGSAIKTPDGFAVLFFGPSGSGKSSATRAFGASGVIADDKLFIRFREDGAVEVADAEEEYTKEEEAGAFGSVWYPVRAVCRLNKSNRAEISDLPPEAVRKLLVDAFFELWWHRNIPDKRKVAVVVQLAEFSRVVKGHDLYFQRPEEGRYEFFPF